jgi:hypothetical protein
MENGCFHSRAASREAFVITTSTRFAASREMTKGWNPGASRVGDELRDYQILFPPHIFLSSGSPLTSFPRK